jgi:hypothetical protein
LAISGLPAWLKRSRNGEEECSHDSPNLGESRGEPRPLAADRRREDFASQKVGLRVWAQIRHDVEQHEAGEDQQGLHPVHEVGGNSGEKQACGTAQEAENLQRNSAHDVSEQYRKDDPDNQQCGNQHRSLGSRNIVRDQVCDAAGMIRVRTDVGGSPKAAA